MRRVGDGATGAGRTHQEFSSNRLQRVEEILAYAARVRGAVTKNPVMKIGRVAILPLSCLTSDGLAEQADDSSADSSTPMTREQWNARVDAAKARVQALRREGKSFVPQSDEDPISRLLDDNTLAYGDIVVTGQGMFQFVGQTEAPHKREDFRQLPRNRSHFRHE